MTTRDIIGSAEETIRQNKAAIARTKELSRSARALANSSRVLLRSQTLTKAEIDSPKKK